MWSAIFGEDALYVDPYHVVEKHTHTYARTTDLEEEINARKKEKQHLAAAQQQSILDDELR